MTKNSVLVTLKQGCPWALSRGQWLQLSKVKGFGSHHRANGVVKGGHAEKSCWRKTSLGKINIKR